MKLYKEDNVHIFLNPETNEYLVFQLFFNDIYTTEYISYLAFCRYNKKVKDMTKWIGKSYLGRNDYKQLI